MTEASPDPDDQGPPRRLLVAAFCVAMVLALACILAGLGIAHYGPRLFPVHARPPSPAAVVASPSKPD